MKTNYRFFMLLAWARSDGDSLVGQQYNRGFLAACRFEFERYEALHIENVIAARIAGVAA